MQSIETLALELTSQETTVTNRHWKNTPQRWACPCCKRTKLHIVRPNQSGQLMGNLVDHHDHIANYADRQITKQVRERGQRKQTDQEGWFKKNKIIPFIVNFEPSLICEDCNNADPLAKMQIEGVCSYFSFSPQQIAYFIKPQAHKPHQIDVGRVHEVFEQSKENYAYRKTFCDMLITRLLDGSRHWGDTVKLPSSIYYRAASNIKDGQESEDVQIAKLIKCAKNDGIHIFSQAVQLYENEVHDSVSRSISEKTEKRDRKQRLKEAQRQKKKSNGYFNHLEPWTKESLEALKTEYLKGTDFEALTKKHGRTVSSLKAQLKKMRAIES